MRWPSALVARVSERGRRLHALQRLHDQIERGANDSELFAEAMQLAAEIVRVDNNPAAWRLAIRVALSASDMGVAAAWADMFAARRLLLEQADLALVDEARRYSALIARASAARGLCGLQRTPGRSLHVLAFSLPYSSNGYAIRSHALLQALNRGGWDTRIYTRPGFPGDSDAAWRSQVLDKSCTVGGLSYNRLPLPSRLGITESMYLCAAAEAFKQVLIDEQPVVVHAGSNHMTALPALIAARELGVGFVYEIRGFWDITRASSDPGFSGSARHRRLRLLENLVCRHADRLLTLTGAMRDELIRRGCDTDRIRLAPNGADSAAAVSATARSELALSCGLRAGVPVVGYIGSFVDYEGLDDLVAAAAMLRDRGVDFDLLLVGDGLMHESVLNTASRLDLADRLRAPGRVPAAQVPSYYALIDVCVYARKPWPVCEMVSPLKPCEAMANGKAVLASSVHALSEVVKHEETGLLFEKGSIVALAAGLERLLGDAPLRRVLGDAARKWVERERTWDHAAHACALSLQEAVFA
jgi:glycosyltransferase involved in cell wall biosynthesis